MIKNYLKIAFRHITRNKTYVLANVLGLGLALSCCIIAFVNHNMALTADTFHDNHEHLYRVLVQTDGLGEPSCDIATPLAPLASEEISGVKAGIRFGSKGVIIQSGPEVFNQEIAIIDPNFLDIFNFPILAGEKSAINDPSQVLITETAAKKYFGEASALQQTIIVNPGQGGHKEFIVGGILKDPPKISSLQFDVLTNIAFVEWGPRPDTLINWTNHMSATFLQLENPTEKEAITQQLQNYITIYNEGNGNSAVKFLLQPMKEVYIEGEDVNNNWISRSLPPVFYWGLWAMALMILLNACLNFTNTTVSFSNKRLKEMGVRKVMGSGRTQLMLQLLGESLVICILATGVAIIATEYFVPIFNQMWGIANIELTLDYLGNPDLLLFLGGTILLVTLLAGAYPAFYISSFKPTHIFRGSTKFGGDNWFVRSLLGFQVAISIMTIIGGIAFAQNGEYLENFDLGYNTKEIINVKLNGKDAYTTFKNVVLQNPDIQGVTGSRNNLGFGEHWYPLGKREENRWTQVQNVGENFFEVMGLNILEGRTFDEKLATDYTNAVLVNRKFIKDQQWTTGLDKQIEIFGEQQNIIGVVGDFYQSAMVGNQSPNVFRLNKPEQYRTLKVKVNKDKLLATNAYLEEAWKATFPLRPFESFYQDKVTANGLIISQNIAWSYLFLAILSIILAATGLFSLVSLNVLKRAKEIAVRRILGATPENITYIVNKHYILIFGIGSVLGGLLGAWFAQILLEQAFAVNQGVSTIAIVLSMIGICTIGALTIGGKLYSVMQTNPAETLKNE